MSAEEIAEWFATGGGNEWGADPESAYAAYEQAQQLYEWFETGGGREWGTDPESAYQAYTQAQAEAGYAEQTEYDQVYTEEEIAAYNAAQQAQYEATPAAGTPADFGGHGAASQPHDEANTTQEEDSKQLPEPVSAVSADAPAVIEPNATAPLPGADTEIQGTAHAKEELNHSLSSEATAEAALSGQDEGGYGTTATGDGADAQVDSSAYDTDAGTAQHFFFEEAALAVDVTTLLSGPDNPDNPVHFAAASGDAAGLAEALQTSNQNTLDSFGRTPLVFAALADSIDCVDQLVQYVLPKQ